MKEKEVKEMNENSSLGHPTRKILYQFIIDNPGISFHLIRHAMKIPEGTLRYHLQQLQRSNRIVKEKNGRNLGYYSKFKKNHPDCYLNVELSSNQRMLLDLIGDFPGATRKDLLIRSRFSRRELNYSLKRLKDLKLIWKVETGNGQGYEMITRDTFKDEMFKILVDRFLKGELSLERFRTLKDKLDKI